MSTPSVLVLWDVDHTLIETRGVGRAIYERVFPAVTGKPFHELATVSGRTELDIIRDTLELHGVAATEQNTSEMAAALTEGYEAARHELAERGRALPGAEDILARLAAEPAIHQGVLSGNLRDVARIKLEVFGLDSYLDLAASAYGDDHAERARLVAIAQHRAERIGVAFGNEHTVLIGDTLNDVAAALTAGVRVIGISTGENSSAELREAGAAAVFADLTEPAALLRSLRADR